MSHDEPVTVVSVTPAASCCFLNKSLLLSRVSFSTERRTDLTSRFYSEQSQMFVVSRVRVFPGVTLNLLMSLNSSVNSQKTPAELTVMLAASSVSFG